MPKAGELLPNGATVLAAKASDHETFTVLCMFRPNSPQPFVIWTVHEDSLSAFNGKYYSSVVDAAKAYDKTV